ncbi:unnamed protein product, partial [Amoebophrya sp. A120]|eukprot:GSA120T00000768001.1
MGSNSSPPSGAADGVLSSKLDDAVPMHFPLTKTTLLKRRKFFIYAIGNTRATNILIRHANLQKCATFETGAWCTGKDVTSESEIATTGVNTRLDLDVLCLGCGDLRNVLFSLVDADPTNTTLRLTINDFDPHVLARNILILDCIYNGINSATAPADERTTEKENKNSKTTTKMKSSTLSVEELRTIFAIWFSLGLTATQRRALNSKLRHLIKEWEATGSCDHEASKVVHPEGAKEGEGPRDSCAMQEGEPAPSPCGVKTSTSSSFRWKRRVTGGRDEKV